MGAAQRVLFGLGDGIEEAARIGETVGVEYMRAFAPTIDARSMLHERQRTRLYFS